MSKKVNLPNIIPSVIPDDIELSLPEKITVDSMRHHFLIEIPWRNHYLDLVPKEYLDFFLTVLPYLKVRTTDVHTAICLALIPKFKTFYQNQPVNWRVITLALILHDCGWSQLTQAEIAQSLGVTGLALTPGAIGPKIAHAQEGAKLALQLLGQFSFNPSLTKEENDLIIKCVLHHDQPEAVAGSIMPIEVQILVDLDHLWSFTHQNFWQDTVRKAIPPKIYAQNLDQDLPTYFVTDFGKELAKSMLKERVEEISAII